ncbi:MAG TPA: M15 family metallopeptidase [Candidatus Faeciplasma avium]|uniref:M15 family metallopeptidase n=1 Tax=Candidatus Faeciplasma avium TaxID=2840798 RepID=A0A9D1T468_9FIRM|nr:M15 family metallopeptidase [Candidatus Faeciplasma avium]
MSGTNYSKNTKRRLRPKYKNIAVILAALLLIISGTSYALSSSRTAPPPADDTLEQDGGSQLPSVELPSLPDEEPVDVDPAETDPTNQNSYYFDFVSMTEADLGTGELVLVNNMIKFRGSVNEEELLVVRDNKNSSYMVSDRNVKLLPSAMSALNEMLGDFFAATGNNGVMARSGYRTVEYQQELYEDDLASSGASSSTLVAMPGYSEHHTGLVVDFTTYNSQTDSYREFDGTGDFAWIMENCHRYGFINRYPEGKEKLTLIDNEPWHFRYVGIPHASIMKDYDFCLEEYIDFIKNYTIDSGFLLKDTDDGARYIVYYVPLSSGETTAVYHPKKHGSDEFYPYSISGNNVDGFIVTVQLREPSQPAVPDNTVEAAGSDSQTAQDNS